MIVLDIETTGLNPFRDELVTIQIKLGSHIRIWKRWETSELRMISGFIEVLKDISRDDPILGYNILKFDLPFMAVRLLILGEMGEGLWSLLYDRNWIDLYQLLGDQYRSLEFWLARFKIPRTCDARGRDIPGLFALKQYEKIVQHAVDDLIACENLYTELKKQHT